MKTKTGYTPSPEPFRIDKVQTPSNFKRITVYDRETTEVEQCL
jgi:hypothetical protein